MCNTLEMSFRNSSTFVVQLRDCNGPEGCGVPEDTLYHLAASGLIDQIRIHSHDTGRSTFLQGGEMARFIAQYEERRQQKILSNVHVNVVAVLPEPAKKAEASDSRKVRLGLET